MKNWYIMVELFIPVVATLGTEKTDIEERGMPMCIAAANRIINRTNAQNVWRYETGKPKVKLTGKRLQKILYLCQLFWYTDHDESQMITEDFQAWPNGPVIPEIYDHFSVYQDGDMYPLTYQGGHVLSEEEADLINIVVDNTIDIPTEAIIDYTHRPGGPWSMVYSNSNDRYKTISNDSIRTYIQNPKHQKELFDFIWSEQK